MSVTKMIIIVRMCYSFSVLLWVLILLFRLHTTISRSAGNNFTLADSIDSNTDSNETELNENNDTINNENENKYPHRSSWQDIVRTPINYMKKMFNGIFSTIFDISLTRNDDKIDNNDGNNNTNYNDTKHENCSNNHLKGNDFEDVCNNTNGNSTASNGTSTDLNENQENNCSKNVVDGQTDPCEKNVTENNEIEKENSRKNPSELNEDNENSELNASKDTNANEHLDEISVPYVISNDINDQSINVDDEVINDNKRNDTSENTINDLINKLHKVNMTLIESEYLNIRTLRQKLLDYLLDYIVTVAFDNVTDTELNETITLEDRLKNYYIIDLDDTESIEFNFDKYNQSNTDDIHVIVDNVILNENNISNKQNLKRNLYRKSANEHTENNTNVPDKLDKNSQKSNVTTEHTKDKANSKTNVSIKQGRQRFDRNNGSANGVDGVKSKMNNSENAKGIQYNKKLITDKKDISNNSSKKDNNGTVDQGDMQKKEEKEHLIQSKEFISPLQTNDGMDIQKAEAGKQSKENELNNINKTKNSKNNITRKNEDFKMTRYRKLMSNNYLNDMPYEDIETYVNNWVTNLNNKKQNSNENFPNIEDTKSEEREKKSVENMDYSFDNYGDYLEHYDQDDDSKLSIEISKGKNNETAANGEKEHAETNEGDHNSNLENKNCDKNIDSNKEKDGNKFKLKLLLVF